MNYNIPEENKLAYRLFREFLVEQCIEAVYNTNVENREVFELHPEFFLQAAFNWQKVGCHDWITLSQKWVTKYNLFRLSGGAM